MSGWGGTAAPAPGLLEQLERARGLGFLGPGPVLDHVRHSEGYLPALGAVSGTIGDLGSGGGVPGLPLALARPDLEVVLIDAGRRRTAFLEEAVVALGLEGRVRIVEARAETVGHGPLRGALDAVVARSFGPPAVTAECAAPLLRVGGRLVVSEPPADEDRRWPDADLALVGLRPTTVVPGPPRLQVLEQIAPCPAAYPRRVGVPAKRPLF